MSQRYTQQQLGVLNADIEFHRRVTGDKILDRLVSAPPESADDRLREIGLAIGATASIDAAELPSLTIGGLLLLSAIDSPFVVGADSVSALDVDIALHILTLGRSALNGCATVEDLENASAGLSEAVGVDRVAFASGISDLIDMSFMAFDRIHGNGGAKRRLDLAWATSMASRVYHASGVSADYVIWHMPLALANYYILADYERMGGRADHGRCKASEAMDRLHLLMDARLAELKTNG